eukprot:jgi/Ulvmu1/11212/UM072_0049.1
MWHAIRPLMRHGRWALIHKHLATIVAAVKPLDGHVLWKATLASAMAQCAAAMGNNDEANQSADAALELAAQAGQGGNTKTDDLRRTMWALKIHIADTGPKAKPVEPKDASPELQADLTTQRVLCKQLTGAAATTAIDAAYHKLDPAPDLVPTSVALLPVARLGWASAVLGEADTAVSLAKRVLMGKDTRARAWAGLILAHTSLEAALPHASACGAYNMTHSCMRRLRELLDDLEQCIQAFLAVGDVHGLHACCRDIWNAGLPLLQHDTRQAVKRVFNAAAAALAAVSSPLTDLRTRLHYEIAKCNVSADSPAAALEEAGRADALDYLGPPKACAKFRLERPWDRHLQPLLATLRARAQDRDPGAAMEPVDKAVELIQRAREARAPGPRRQWLRKAMAALQRVPLVQPALAEGAEAGGAGAGETEGGVGLAGEDAEQRYRSARLLTSLWGEVLMVAWAQHLHDVVLQAAPYVLWPEWTVELDQEMAMLQCQCMYFEAEAAVLALKHRGEMVVPPLKQPDASGPETGGGPAAAAGGSDTGADASKGAVGGVPASDAVPPGTLAPESEHVRVRPAAQTVLELQQTVAQGFIRGMQRAIECERPWAVINGAVYCWNAYLPAMQQGWYSPIAQQMLAAARRLISLEADQQQQELLRNIVVAASKGAKHRCLLEMIESQPGQPDRDSQSVDRKALPSVSLEQCQAAIEGAATAQSLSDEAQVHLKAALELIEGALVKVTDIPCQELLESCTQVQALLGLPPAQLPTILPEQQAVSEVLQTIEALSASSPTELDAAAITDLQTRARAAIEKLTAEAPDNVELWAKLAAGALHAGLTSPAVRAARSALALTAQQRPEGLARSACAFASGKPKHAQFWQAAAAITCSRAFLAGVSPPTQTLPVQMTMRLEVAWYAALAAQLAVGLGRSDTLRAAVQCMWNACCGGCEFAALRAAFVDPLTLACGALHAAGGAAPTAGDPWLTARINALLCACLLSAGRPGDAVAHARAWQRPPPHAAHRELWGWVFEVTRAPEMEAAAVTEKLGMYPRAFQAEQWLAAARAAPGAPEQRKALERACKAATVDPVLAAEVQLAYAEWLLCCGAAAATEPDVAARVAQAVTVLVCKDATAAAKGTAFTLAAEPVRPCSASSDGSAHAGHVVKTTGQGGVHVSALRLVQQALAAGCVDGAAGLDVMLRSCVLASLAVEDGGARLPWLLCARACAEQMAASALHLVWLEQVATADAAAADMTARQRGADEGEDRAAAEAGEGGPEQGKEKRGFPAAPGCLWAWLELQLSPEELRTVLGKDRPLAVGAAAGLDITKETLPWPERTLAWLECLVRQLRACGCSAHAVPVRWLQVLVSARLVGGAAKHGFLAQLSAALEELGCVEEAMLYAQAAGPPEVDIDPSCDAQVHKYAALNSALADGLQGFRCKTVDVLNLIHGQTAGVLNTTALIDETALLAQVAGSQDAGAQEGSTAMRAAVTMAASAAKVHAQTAQTLLPLARHQLLPAQPQHELLWHATAMLAMPGCNLNRAYSLLRVSAQHADARQDGDCRARCLLHMAEIDGLAGDAHSALLLAQAAHQGTKDTSVWRDAVITYCRNRLATGSGVRDALAALRHAVTMLTRAPQPAGALAATEHCSHAVPLYLELAHVLGVAQEHAMHTAAGGHKHGVERLQVLKRAVEAAATHGTPSMHVAATLALCAALRAEVSTLAHAPADPRPFLQQLMRLLYAAEARLLGFLPLCAPPDAPQYATHPIRAEHARLLVHLACMHAEHARADLVFAESDLRAKRPVFAAFSRPPSTGSTHAAVIELATASARELADSHESSAGSGGNNTGTDAAPEGSPSGLCGSVPAAPSEKEEEQPGPVPSGPQDSSVSSMRGGDHAGPSGATTPEARNTCGNDMHRADLEHAGRTDDKRPGQVSSAVVEQFLDATEQEALAEQGEGAVKDAAHAFHAARHACAALALCDRGAVAVDGRVAHARARLAELQLHALLNTRLGGTTGVGPAAADAADTAPVTTRGDSEALEPALAATGSMLRVAADADVATGNGNGEDVRGASTEAPAGVVVTCGPSGTPSGIARLVEEMGAEVVPLLRHALSGAIRLRDWPRATEVALELLQVLRLRLRLHAQQAAAADIIHACAPEMQPPEGLAEAEGGTGGGAGEDSLDEHVDASVPGSWKREVAELVMLWRACDALREDCAALSTLGPPRHTARVLQRVEAWWRRSEDAERHAWCTDLEPEALLSSRPDADDDDKKSAADAEAAGAEEGAGVAGGGAPLGGPQDPPGFARQLRVLEGSAWVNGRVAGMLCGSPSQCAAALPPGVAVLVLAIEQRSGQDVLGAAGVEAMVHAVSARQAPGDAAGRQGGQEGAELVHCEGTIDTAALERVRERLGAWEARLHEAQVAASREGGATLHAEERAMGEAAEGSERPEGTAEAEAGGQAQEAEEATRLAEAGVPREAAADKLADEWAGIVAEMDAMLRPIQEVVAAAAAEVAAPLPPEPPKGKKGALPSEPTAPLRPSVVVCCCPLLAALPLEALPGLTDVAAVARERSAQHAAARWQLAVRADATAAAATMEVAKAAFSVSQDLQDVVATRLQAVPRSEWQVNMYRPDRGVSQAYHMMMAKESQGMMHWTCDRFDTHVHGETMAGLELLQTAFVSVMDRLTIVPSKGGVASAHSTGGVAGDGAAGGVGEGVAAAPAAAAPKEARQDREVGSGDCGAGLGLEERTCMLLQRGAVCCVSNRWPLPAEDALSVMAAALPPHCEGGVAAAVRRAAAEVAALRSAPWLASGIVVHGLPGLVLTAGAPVDDEQRKKKQKK